MADRKITDLTALAAGSQATGDLLTIVDVSEAAATDKNKKITVESLFKGIPGDVGIGTASPLTKFHIARGSDDNSILYITGADTSSEFVALGVGANYGMLTAGGSGSTSTDLIFRTANSGTEAERLRIDSSGNVGIGTSSPGTQLHVNGSTPTMRVSHGSTQIVEIKADTAASILRTTTNHPLLFGTNDTERLRIDSSGNVGIGTSSPTSVLHIKSDTNNNVNNGFLFEAADSTHKIFRLYENGTGEAYSRWYYQDTAKVLIRSNGASYFTGGNVGVNTSSPGRTFDVDGVIRSDGTSGALALGGNSSTPSEGCAIHRPSNNTMAFVTGTNERMRIDSSGRVGIGETSMDGLLVIKGDSNASSMPSIRLKDGTDTREAWISNASGDLVLVNGGDDNTPHCKITMFDGNIISFETVNTERIRIQSTGYTQFGGYLNGTGSHRLNGINATQGDALLVISGYQLSGGSSQDTGIWYSVNTGGSVSSSAAGLRMYKNTGTNRSINTAGTINASGADYAEYMTKAGDFTLAKGDICGINSEGKLTNVFADAISFVVKSTDPSYVGGDKWHETAGEEPGGHEDTRTEEEIAAAKVIYEEALEAARQLVDRIAFSGQVPVNVTGATPGQHIIPTAAADGSIEGTAKAEADLTMAEYMSSVGKVIAVEDDGRAKIIVKVA